jgi:hypothetical protein
MSTANKFITGPGGAWVNGIMTAFMVFMLTKMYARFEDMEKNLNTITTQIEVHEYRLDIIDRTKPNQQ